MYLPIYVRIFIKKASYHIYYRLKMSKSNRFFIVHVMVAASLNQLCIIELSWVIPLCILFRCN